MQETTMRAELESSPDPYDDDDTYLADYLLILWRRRWIIIGATVLCGLAAYVSGKTSTPVYEASVKMMVSPPKTVQAGEVAPTVSVATFRALVENQSLAAQIIKEFGLGEGPMRMTPQRFLGSALTVESPRDTNIVVLRVRLGDPKLPARVANRLAALAVELAERLNQQETLRTRDHIKAQVDESRARLDTAERELAAFRQEAQIEALKEDVNAELEQRGGLLPLLVRIQTERARLAKAEEELSKRKPVGTVKRTIDNDPALMEAAKETAKSGSGILGLQVSNEYPNKVYEEIDQQVADSRTRLSGLEKQKSELIDALKLNSGQLAKLNLLYVREGELARRETEYDLAQKVYLDVATRFEQARLQVAGRSAQLQLLDAALPPDRPVGARVLRSTALASVLGFMLSACAALFWAAIASAQARQHVAEAPKTDVDARV